MQNGLRIGSEQILQLRCGFVIQIPYDNIRVTYLLTQNDSFVRTDHFKFIGFVQCYLRDGFAFTVYMSEYILIIFVITAYNKTIIKCRLYTNNILYFNLHCGCYKKLWDCVTDFLLYTFKKHSRFVYII